MPTPAPSGQQVEIRHKGQTATIVEVGGGVRAYHVDGRPVLDGYDVKAMCDGGRGTPLLPWPNRILDGHYVFRDQELQLALTEPPRHNAIHGLARWANWSALDVQPARVTMGLDLHPQPGYPFSLALRITYVLSDAGLAVHTEARNVGAAAAPFGAGQHPYLTVGATHVDEADLEIPAASLLDMDERGIPTGRRLPVGQTDLDFRRFRRIGDARLDHCFADLERDDQGRAWLRLRAGPGGPHVALWLDASYRYVQAFTGDTLAPSRRRTGLALEPATCPANAFNTGAHLRVLEPGESWEGAWGLADESG